MVLMLVLDCKVLNHLINNVAPSFVNRTSPLANCLDQKIQPYGAISWRALERSSMQSIAMSYRLMNLERHHIVRSKRLKGNVYVSMIS